MSSRIDSGVWQAARATVTGMLAHDPSYSLASLLEDALIAEIDRLEREHHGGEPWPDPPSPSLRRGRRTSSGG